jgi:hypothetical protein
MRYLLLRLPAEQTLDVANVRLVDVVSAAKAAAPFGGLLLEIVALHGVTAQDAATAGDLEPLLRG